MIDNIIFPDSWADNYIIKLLVACILGAIIGVERDVHGRAAGLRTNLLVSLGAALFMILSEQIAYVFDNFDAHSLIRVDPGRIAAQIITGIGFLGAGTIIKYGFTVKGLTTAACLWLSAGLGMSVGAGFFDLAIIATFMGLAGLILFNFFEKSLSKDNYRILQITSDINYDINPLIEIVNARNLKIMHQDREMDYDSKRKIIKFNIRISQKGYSDNIAEDIIPAIEKADLPLYSVKWYHV